MSERAEPVSSPQIRYVAARAGLSRIARCELKMVRQLAGIEGWPRVSTAALVLNRLSNGWLYILIGMGLLWFRGERASAVLAAGALAVGVGHIVYPRIKRLTARPRPCDIDPSLKPLLKALDKYSFPSGHCMTVTCVLIPVVMAFPELSTGSTLLWALICWARLATAHHYPSDLLAGTALGAMIALPITNLIQLH